MVIAAAATTTSIVSVNKLYGIVNSFDVVNDGSSCRRTNLTGVKIYHIFSQRQLSSIGAVSSIHGNAQFSFPSSGRSSFNFPENLDLIGGHSAPEALPSACENASLSSIKSFNQLIETLIERVDLSESEAESSLEYLLREGIKRCVEESGIAFMMSPMYHPAMKIVGPVRKKLKIKTIFNILGHMRNPASVSYAVVGVYHKYLVLKMAKALQRFGMKRALVVHLYGLDEMSPLDKFFSYRN